MGSRGGKGRGEDIRRFVRQVFKRVNVACGSYRYNARCRKRGRHVVLRPGGVSEERGRSRVVDERDRQKIRLRRECGSRLIDVSVHRKGYELFSDFRNTKAVPRQSDNVSVIVRFFRKGDPLGRINCVTFGRNGGGIVV